MEVQWYPYRWRYNAVIDNYICYPVLPLAALFEPQLPPPWRCLWYPVDVPLAARSAQRIKVPHLMCIKYFSVRDSSCVGLASLPFY